LQLFGEKKVFSGESLITDEKISLPNQTESSKCVEILGNLIEFDFSNRLAGKREVISLRH
jgi:hypothetical protein